MNNLEHPIFHTLEEAIKQTPPGGISIAHLSFERGENEVHPLICMVLQGIKEGPALWVQGGMHGDEYDGLVAAMELTEQLDLQQLAGRLIVVPVVNPTAFEAGQNMSPLDGINLNRVFPGNTEGSFSYKYGAWLFDQISRQSDCVIDLHGGGKFLEVSRFVMIAETEGEADKLSYELASICGAEYIYVNSSQSSGMLYSALSRAGIPALLLENGGGMTWSREAVTNHLDSIKAIMTHMGMIAGTTGVTPGVQTITHIAELRFNSGGLQTYHVKAGDRVTQNTPLIEVRDMNTMRNEHVLCPVDKGVILSIHTAALVQPDGYAVMIGQLSQNQQ